MTCSSASVRRGNQGKVVVTSTSIARITQWEVTRSVEETAWGDSDSAGFTNRVPGREDATGSIKGKIDSSNRVYDVFDVGDVVTLILWESTSDYWYFPCALIRNYHVICNTDTKEAMEWNADFASDGRFYRPGATGIPAASYPS